jgi:hypothetical protein
MAQQDIQKLKAIQTMPTVKSSDADWIRWSDFVIGKYGSGLGKQIFINVWEKRGSRNANTRAIRQHLKDKYNIVINESVWDNVVDAGGSIADSVSSVLKVGKYATLAVGVIVIGGLAMIIFNIGKDPAKAVGAATKAALI